MSTITPKISPQRRQRRTIWLWLTALVLAAIVFAAVRVSQGYPLLRSRQLHGTVLTQSAPVANFSLTAPSGEKVALSDFRGQIVLLYFGYTHCPDVCPLTMLNLAKAQNALPQRYQDDVQVLMVTVDPDRDTPDLLANYLSHFDSSFLGLTGTQTEIKAATASIGIFYEKQEMANSDDYFMDHTASVAVLDRRGQLRMLWPFGTSAEEIASDLSYWVRLHE